MAAFEHHGAVADLSDQVQRVRDENDRVSLVLDATKPGHAIARERVGATGGYTLNEQDIRAHMQRPNKSTAANKSRDETLSAQRRDP